MPIPNRRKNEDKTKFLSRCMSDEIMKKDYPDNKQRVAICLHQATADCGYVEAADFKMQIENCGYEEELDDSNLEIPSQAEYEDFGEQEEEWDVASEKPGLWENIRKKKEREGKDYKPAKPGDPDRPSPDSWKKAQSAENSKVKLNKPFRTPSGPKKFSVYVKNDKGNVVKVNFGDPNMEIKRDDPERRKSYRARHHCDNPGPKWKANYWSCKMWSKTNVSDLT